MAQVLKDKVRDEILNATRKELFEHGVEKASLRRIAIMAKMTPGNLYRYYKNKNDLVNLVLEGTIEAIDSTLRDITGKSLMFNNGNMNETLTFDEALDLCDQIGSYLTKVYKSHHMEMQIIMNNDPENEMIRKWITRLLKNMAVSWNIVVEPESYYDVMAVSLFNGISYIFKNIKDEKEQEAVIALFLRRMLLSIK